MAALGIDETFAGYLIEGVLGRGGMGTVYLARHPRLPRRVALKLLDREVSADHELRRRFDQEADIVARLEHPGIVRIYDRGADAGHLWISMQYVHGGDVDRLDRRALSVEQAVRLIAETGAALDYAHSKGVLHRDVKPANILLEAPEAGRAERAVLTDFGIARLQDADTHLTVTGTLTATLAYASPEQLSGDPLDHRSDQYSLACTLFTLLAGSPPYAGTNPGQVVAGHITKPIPRLTVARSDLPPAVDAVLARAMGKRPDERYDNCGEFVANLRAALSGNAFGAPSPMFRASGPDVPALYLPGAQQNSHPGRAPAVPSMFAERDGASTQAGHPTASSPDVARAATGYPAASGPEQGRAGYPAGSGPEQSQAQAGHSPRSWLNGMPGSRPQVARVSSPARGSGAGPARMVSTGYDSGAMSQAPGESRRRSAGRRIAVVATVIAVLAGTGVGVAMWSSSPKSGAAGWESKYRAIAESFPHLLAAQSGGAGWFGTQCSMDPASTTRPAITCDNADRDFHFEVTDLGNSDAATEFAAEASKNSGDMLAVHPGFPAAVDLVLPTPDSTGPQDLYTLFPQDSQRSRFVLGLRWGKHAALETYDRWWRQLPIGTVAPSPNPTPEPPGTSPWCYVTQAAASINDNGPGGTGSGPDAVLAFEYAQYNSRSGAAARQFVAPESTAVPSAQALQTEIDQVPVGTQHCVHITGTAVPDRYQVQIFERRPDRGFLHHGFTAITTTRDGRVLIKEIRD